MSKFKIDDRVKFVRNTKGYSLGQDNPLVGTQWECEGIITGFFDQGAIVMVDWDNHNCNDYALECLELVKPKMILDEGLFTI